MSPLASSLSIITSIVTATSPLGASAARVTVAAPEQPGPPTSDTEGDPLADLSTPEPDEESGGTGPVVHIINELPDEERGLLKLARYTGTTTQAGGNIIVVTTNYVELCTEPCGVPVDVSDRPQFFLVRDGQPVSYAFRLKAEPEVTLSVRPLRAGMRNAGLYLTLFFIYPAGIPLLLLGRPKVSVAPGSPSAGQSFKKPKKAKS
jgi:hypothetical protein